MSSGSGIAHAGRTLRALELLAVEPRSAPELADGLGVHVRTARRLLKQLVCEGYVVLGGDRRRRYHPTMRIVAVAGQVVDRAQLTTLAAPHLRTLRDQLGEDCHLCVSSYLSALCLVHVSGNGPVPCRPQLRELVPCHCTATGKALLAWREGWREAVLEQPLRAFTERTITGPGWLRRELDRIRARGYAFEDREFDTEVRGVAAPVCPDGAEAVAAVGVTGPADRLLVEERAAIADAAECAASEISRGLAECSELT